MHDAKCYRKCNSTVKYRSHGRLVQLPPYRDRPDALSLAASHSQNLSKEPALVENTDSLLLEHSDDHCIMQESFTQYS